jgi:hypothetical protein
VLRFNENQLLQDAYLASSGESIDITKYNNIEHPFALCFTNDMVNAINERWNKFYSTGKRILKVTGFDNTEYNLYTGLVLMSYKNHCKYRFTNSQELTVKDWTAENCF